MRKNRSPWLSALLMLTLCASILVGSTLAYFTDEVKATGNIVQSGNLDVELKWTDDLTPAAGETVAWADASNTVVFNNNRWEPGYTDVKYFQIVNNGNLAFQYELNILPTLIQEGPANLMDVIDVYFGMVSIGDEITRANYAETLAKVGNLTQLMTNENGAGWGIVLPRNGSADAALPAGMQASTGEAIACVVLHMQESAGNEYMGASAGEGFKLQLVATQYTYEKDAFGNTYDQGATLPNVTAPTSVSVSIEGLVGEDGLLTEDVVFTSLTGVTATVPAGSLVEEGAVALQLLVNPIADSQANITVGKGEELFSYDVHIDGLSADNTMPAVINMGEVLPKGLNMGNYTLYHVENGASTKMTYNQAMTSPKHNDFTYDPATGEVTVAMATFSEVAMVAEPSKWEGEFDYTWYDASKTELTIANADQLAGFGAIVGGMKGQTQDSFKDKTVKLIADINLGDAEAKNDPDLIFHPIGYYYTDDNNKDGTTGDYYSTVKTFEGTFDGNGHTISNFYQNTWEIKGDYDGNYYRDAMGLFGRVVGSYKGTVKPTGGIIKNLTVDNFSSDGEYTTTGVIAAYADGATFENIAITNCNPRVYNIGNGGIVGCVGWYAKEENLKTTFTNITVDNSNKISALWGSYDVACGGLVGQYYPTSGQSSANYPVNAGIDFVNCHVSAQIDVYNDVCANYQYYAYRYAGMMIGSIRENTTNDDGKTIPNMTGITATDCTVNYGDWNDYYYCEFEKNGHPSYSGPDDYKFSRVLHSELEFKDSNKNGLVDANERESVTGCKHDHNEAENNQAIYLPFHQLFTGYGWGVNSIGLEKYSGIVTDLGITEGDQQESVEKFVAIQPSKTGVDTGSSIKVSELFKAKDGAKIHNDSVIVAISKIDPNSSAGGTFTKAEKWQESTVTFTGSGKVKVSIQDYNFCKPTELTIDINAIEKFETKFTGDFLYRVGNQNAVALGSLFAAKGGAAIGNVTVTIATVKGNAAGAYVANNSDWTKGTIQFSGTGVVEVTIKDTSSDPCSLYLEVVDAFNVTSASGGNYPLKNRNSVLLNDIKMATNGNFWLENATLYGNGFAFDVTAGEDGDTTNGYIGGNYAVALKNAILDNVRIIGEVYTKYGAQAKAMYNYPTILTNGNSIIANSYVSNGSAAVRAQDGNLQIINSTLEGGIFANLDIRGGTVTLDNVITINQSTAGGQSISNDQGIVGLGIVFYECNVNAELIVKTDANGNPLLTQYNCISEKTEFESTEVNQLKKAMFGQEHKALQYTDNGVVWINPCIVSATEGIGMANITNLKGYMGKDASVMGQDGFVYTVVPTKEIVNEVPFAYESKEQYYILPTVVFDHTAEQNYKAPSAGSNEFCYFNNDTNQLEISFDEGKNKVYDPNILSVTKAGNNLPVYVKIDGTDKTDKTITFDKAGTYKAVYTYTDPYNFRLNEDGAIETFDVSYEQTVNIAVSAVEAAAKDAKFTFYGYSSISKTAATTITDVKTVTSSSGNLYIMPSSTGANVTSKSIDGITVNCPRVYVDFKNNSSDFNWLYPIFLGVKIEDYANGGTAKEPTLIVSPESTSKPDNLTILTVDKPSGGGGWSSGSGKSGNEGKIGSGTYKDLYGWTSGALGSDQPANSIYGQFTYKDNKGTTYYYVIEFYRAAHDCPSVCVTPDTLVTLADGSKKEIQYVTYDDQLLVWDFYNGCYATVPSAIIFNHGEDDFNIIYLTFEDGTVVKVIKEHRFLDTATNDFVRIDEFNAQDYVGHSFYKMDGNDIVTVKLQNAEVKKEHSVAYSLISALHYNFFVEDLFSSPFMEKDVRAFEYFDIAVDELKYINVDEDIAQYGLYTYEEFAPYITKEQYDAFNVQYMKIAVGKGDVTFEEILRMINEYLTESK